MSELQYGSSDTASNEQHSWDRVREAIAQHWPQINQDELKSCEESTKALTEYVSLRVHSNRDEIQSLVERYSPEAGMSLSDLTESASKHARRASDAVGQVYQTAETRIQQHPAESTAVAFISGLLVGAIGATLYFTSRPQPSLWQHVHGGFRRG